MQRVKGDQWSIASDKHLTRWLDGSSQELRVNNVLPESSKKPEEIERQLKLFRVGSELSEQVG